MSRFVMLALYSKPSGSGIGTRGPGARPAALAEPTRGMNALVRPRRPLCGMPQPSDSDPDRVNESAAEHGASRRAFGPALSRHHVLLATRRRKRGACAALAALAGRGGGEVPPAGRPLALCPLSGSRALVSGSRAHVVASRTRARLPGPGPRGCAGVSPAGGP